MAAYLRRVALAEGDAETGKFALDLLILG